MKETAFKRKIKDKQFFTDAEESISDKNINLLANQAPTQAAIRDLSCYSFLRSISDVHQTVSSCQNWGCKL